jgi:hypothetical protein
VLGAGTILLTLILYVSTPLNFSSFIKTVFSPPEIFIIIFTSAPNLGSFYSIT